MRVFITVVDEQGFSAASRALSMPLPTVCRKVAELEKHLGAQLLIRTTRKVTVTDSGQHFYEDIRRILNDIDDAERKVAGEYQAPKGHLRITAPTMFGRVFLLPIITDFMKNHVDISIRLQLTNTVVDLVEENIDLGIRVGVLLDSSLVVSGIGSVRNIVCASPDYISKYKRPLSPNDLPRHHCVAFTRNHGPTNWIFKLSSGKVESFSVNSRLSLDTVEGMVLAIARGGRAGTSVFLPGSKAYCRWQVGSAS